MPATANATEQPQFYIASADGVPTLPANDGLAKDPSGRPKDTLQQRLEREKKFAKTFYNKNNSGLVTPGESQVHAQGITPDECLDIDTGEPRFQHKDRFTSCKTSRFGLGTAGQNALNFAITTAYSAATDGTQGVREDIYIYDGRVDGSPPSSWRDIQVGIQVLCTAVSTSCSTSGMTTKNMGEWISGEHRFSQTTTVGGTSAARDGKAFYELGLTYFDPVTGTVKVYDPTDFLRCDVATYVPGAAQGCVFTARTLALNMIHTRDRYPDVVDHIYAAQFHPATTKPGTFSLIPGGVQDGTPLTRLYPGYDKVTYDRNHSKAVSTCKQFWGNDYTQGGTLDCDEYPFRSTYQGAAYSDNGGTVGYSALPLNLSQNRAAGNDLGAFYKENRILDSDGFYVNVFG